MSDGETAQDGLGSGGAVSGLTPDEAAFFESKGEKGGIEPAQSPDRGDRPIPAPEKAAEPEKGGKPAKNKDGSLPVDAEGASEGEGEGEQPTESAEAKKKREYIPPWRYNELREREKAARAEADQLKAQIGAYNERLAMLQQWQAQQQQQPQQPAQPVEPYNPDDPIARINHIETRQRQLDELAQRYEQDRQQYATQQQQMQQAAQQLQEAMATVAQNEAQFIADNPDYAKALEYVRGVRVKQLKAQGIPDYKITQSIGLEERNFALYNLAANRNPAAALYENAKLIGYNPAPAAETPNPATQQQQEVAQQQSDAAAQLTRAAKTMNAAGKSLSNAPGAPAGNITFEKLAEMSTAEFAALYKRDPGLVDRLMGKPARA